MRIRTKVMDMTGQQWDRLQEILHTEYAIPPGAITVSATFELHAQGPERRVDMPLSVFGAVMQRLNGEAGTAAARLPVLPTTDQVRNLDAAGAVQLAEALNEDRQFEGRRPE